MNNQGLFKHQRKKYNEGVSIEDNFIEIANKLGYSCSKSSKYQDVYEHWDIKINVSDDVYEYVDIKGMKDVHNLGYTWVEEKNVRGDIGWLYASKLDSIVFEKLDCFVFVKLSDLREMVNSNLRYRTGLFFDKGKDVRERVYCRYQRPGRCDVIILVPFDDIDKLVYRKFLK